MSILIKGMEMPAQGEFKHIRIYDNGDVTVEVEGGEAVIAHASTVPPHGRLIDADALEKDIDKYIGGEESQSRFHHWVQVQRTVIPESKEART